MAIERVTLENGVVLDIDMPSGHAKLAEGPPPEPVDAGDGEDE